MGNSAAVARFPRLRSRALLRLVSDERLVEFVRGGSEAAFEVIYDRHHRGILAFCRHMLLSREEGEDALQHTFMAAYRHLAGGEAEIRLRPWLYAIARNRCLSLLRARREQPLDELREPATEHLSAEAQRRQDVREVLADVAALPDDQRAALVLAELGAVSHDEIAMVLEVPRQKVKALVFQARTSLAASRTARETPCTEIREQLANLRGGALRRTTLHRHLRECAGCRAFREEVALQRRTLAVALPVIPTLGLKEAALGGAFGSTSAGGAAAASGGAAVAAKALVAVALVGGGTTAGVEITRHAAPPAPARSAPPHTAAPVHHSAAAPAARGEHAAQTGRSEHAARGKAKQIEQRAAGTAEHAAKGNGDKAENAADKPARSGGGADTGPGTSTAPGKAVGRGKASAPGQASTPGDAARPGKALGRGKASAPGQSSTPGDAARPGKAVGRGKASAPGQATTPTEPKQPDRLVAAPEVEVVPKAVGKLK